MSERQKMTMETATWTREDRITRLHRCRLFLHGEGVLSPSENVEVYRRIDRLVRRKHTDDEKMEEVVLP